MKPGRIILTAVLGLLFGLFVGLDLVMLGIVPLNSAVVTVLAAVGLLGGGLLGGLASKRVGAGAVPTASIPPPPPPPM